MAGFDFPQKLRERLGAGDVLQQADIQALLKIADADNDQQLSCDELASFFSARALAGEWLSLVLAKSVWQMLETAQGGSLSLAPLANVALILHQLMQQPPRPERRYVLDPEKLGVPAPGAKAADVARQEAVVGRTAAPTTAAAKNSSSAATSSVSTTEVAPKATTSAAARPRARPRPRKG